LEIDEEAAALGTMDALLPGGCGFPKASETGMGTVLLDRLRRADATLPARLAAAVRAAGEAFDPGDEARRHAAAAHLEAAEPKLFCEVRKLAYLTYYEQPAVIAAIRALGFRYNDAPLPEGYPADPFVPERDAPRHARGRWTRTEDVRRADLSQLDLEGTTP
jgi:hypothetical protein